MLAPFLTLANGVGDVSTIKTVLAMTPKTSTHGGYPLPCAELDLDRVTNEVETEDGKRVASRLQCLVALVVQYNEADPLSMLEELDEVWEDLEAKIIELFDPTTVDYSEINYQVWQSGKASTYSLSFILTISA